MGPNNFSARNPADQRSEVTSQSLIFRIKSKDASAWDRLVQLYGPLIYYWSRQSHLSPEDAADVTQEVFRRVLTGIDGFRRERSGDTFRGWLWTISRNVIRDLARNGSNGARAAGGTEANMNLQMAPDLYPAPQDEPSSDGAIHELMQRGLTMIQAEFNDQAWKAFQLTMFQGYNATEAGQQVGMTGAAVRQAKSRILRRLREELGELDS